MKNNKVCIFFGVVAIAAIFIAIFAVEGSRNVLPDITIYEDNIQNLTDTIKSLKEDIAKYQAQIDTLEVERDSIRKEIELIIKDNEKVDSELSNGDWDTNIKFLTEFLSKNNTLGE